MSTKLMAVLACLIAPLSACASVPSQQANVQALVLTFRPENQQIDDMLDGRRSVRVAGSVRNDGQSVVPIPDLLLVLRDDADRIVFRGIVEPPLPSIEPGDTVMIHQTLLDVPKEATALEIGWAPE